MAVNPNNRRRQVPYQNLAQNYASRISQAFNPAIEAVRARLGAYLSPKQIETNVGDMFSGALQSAGQIGERSGAVTNQLTSNLVSGLRNLPGLDPNAIPLALSRAVTSTAGAAVTSEAMRSQVELARALAIQQAKARREEGMASENERLANLIIQQEQAKADYLPYAQGMSSLDTARLARETSRVELDRLRDLIPIELQAEIFKNKVLRKKLAAFLRENAGASSSSGGGYGGTTIDDRLVNFLGQTLFPGDKILPSGAFFFDAPGDVNTFSQGYGVTGTSGGSPPAPVMLTRPAPGRRPRGGGRRS